MNMYKNNNKIIILIITGSETLLYVSCNILGEETIAKENVQSCK
jgi:hypothetical protein